MISQTELLNQSAKFGLPLTAQTIRNYIKTGLCHGAKNTINGIQTRGTLPDYPSITLPEALTAKYMLQVRGRKLDRLEVIFAKFWATKILQNENFALNDESMLEDICVELKKYNYEVEVDNSKIIWRQSTAPTITAVLTGNIPKNKKRKEYSLDNLRTLAAEWITVFVNFNDNMFLRLCYEYPSIYIPIKLNIVFLEKFNVFVGVKNDGKFGFSQNIKDFIPIHIKVKRLKSLKDVDDYAIDSPELNKVVDSLYEEAETLPSFINYSNENYSVE